jgi:hypothetical protein
LKTAFMVLVLLMILCGCEKHLETSSALNKTATSNLHTVTSTVTSEPVAVPQRLQFKIHGVVPNAGISGSFGIPGVTPVDIDGTLFYGPSEPKTTHEESDSTGTSSSGLQQQKAKKTESKPFGIFALLSANWPWLLLAIPVLLVVFRKKLGPLLKFLPFPFSLLAPKDPP